MVVACLVAVGAAVVVVVVEEDTVVEALLASEELEAELDVVESAADRVALHVLAVMVEEVLWELEDVGEEFREGEVLVGERLQILPSYASFCRMQEVS